MEKIINTQDLRLFFLRQAKHFCLYGLHATVNNVLIYKYIFFYIPTNSGSKSFWCRSIIINRNIESLLSITHSTANRIYAQRRPALVSIYTPQLSLHWRDNPCSLVVAWCQSTRFYAMSIGQWNWLCAEDFFI